MNTYQFLIVVENAGQNYSAYSPDLPGCVATGATREEAENTMFEAIQLHIEGLKEDGLPIPSSTATAEYVFGRRLVPHKKIAWFRGQSSLECT